MELAQPNRVELFSRVSPTIWGSLRFPFGVLRICKVPSGATICTYALCGVVQYKCLSSFGTYPLDGLCMPQFTNVSVTLWSFPPPQSYWKPDGKWINTVRLSCTKLFTLSECLHSNSCCFLLNNNFLSLDTFIKPTKVTFLHSLAVQV